MKVLLAPDKFKGSLTAAQVAHHLAIGLRRRGISSRALPLADGGDGSVQAAIAAGFRAIALRVDDAIGRRHVADVAFDGTTAVIEVANTCGLHTLPAGALAPDRSSTAGVGQAIRSVLEFGPSRIVLALGGSASTDGGAGMLAALGAVFRDRAGSAIAVDGGHLRQIHTVDTGELVDLRQIDLVIAGDVRNPLTGPDGAAAIFGPQKGAGPELVDALDAGLAHLVRCVTAAGHADAPAHAAAAGAGAAGGLGFAALLLGGRPVSGADYFLDLLRFETHLHGCDLVITGEGRMDDQTLQGKLPAVVARRAGVVPVVAVVGRSDISAAAQRRIGIRAVHGLTELTSDDPARDPELTATLLEELGRTIALPSSQRTRGLSSLAG